MEGLKETSSIIRDNKYQSINESKLYFSIKRLIDVIGALIGMFLFFPLFIVIAITMKIQDKKGTIFFRQKRVGKHGEIFYIYKFRSMVSNAE
ncbi:MAG TPA: sugar transferase, partial [Metabacillus sp.]|nr:sugar transferase [Metabacillus sp.]